MLIDFFFESHIEGILLKMLHFLTGSHFDESDLFFFFLYNVTMEQKFIKSMCFIDDFLWIINVVKSETYYIFSNIFSRLSHINSLLHNLRVIENLLRIYVFKNGLYLFSSNSVIQSLIFFRLQLILLKT